MNADSTFQIGKDHIVCQDYALSAAGAGIAYAIVCDGCSASPDVDFGARALAMAAKNRLWFTGAPWFTNAKTFGYDVIRDANKIFSIFPRLHPQALDATLLIAWVQDNKLTAVMYGDGVIIHRSKTESHLTHVTLTSGAPDYLSYHLDSARKDSYDKMGDNEKEVTICVANPAISCIVDKSQPFDPVIIERGVQEGDMIAVISDGINSFRKQDNTPIDWKELMEEFTGFKTTEGEFVKRRIGAFKRKCLKDNTTHSDDISIASIVV
jgi:hypothetical protein